MKEEEAPIDRVEIDFAKNKITYFAKNKFKTCKLKIEDLQLVEAMIQSGQLKLDDVCIE